MTPHHLQYQMYNYPLNSASLEIRPSSTFSHSFYMHMLSWASLTIKNLPAMWETWVRSLGQEDPLERGMATHLPGEFREARNLVGYSPGGRRDWVTNTSGASLVAQMVENLHAGDTLLTLFIKHLFYVRYSVRLWGSKINTVRLKKKQKRSYFIFTALCGFWNLSYPTRDWTLAPSNESTTKT